MPNYIHRDTHVCHIYWNIYGSMVRFDTMNTSFLRDKTGEMSYLPRFEPSLHKQEMVSQRAS